jgi:hypothetical protein
LDENHWVVSFGDTGLWEVLTFHVLYLFLLSVLSQGFSSDIRRECQARSE